ncbi:MAG: hypothetical protein HYV07_07385 [Deltaproteobacteria bacterium]|nr:hypothetical protein [Deltaproteobacteria bacterium]
MRSCAGGDSSALSDLELFGDRALFSALQGLVTQKRSAVSARFFAPGLPSRPTPRAHI